MSVLVLVESSYIATLSVYIHVFLFQGPAGRYVSIADLADTSSVLTVFRSLFAVALSSNYTTDTCEPEFAKDTVRLDHGLHVFSVDIKHAIK